MKGGGAVFPGLRGLAGDGLWKILNGLPHAVAYAALAEDPRILFINESFTRIFGYTLDDIPRVADWARLAYPDEVYRRETFRAWDAAVAKAVESQGGVESMEFRVACKNGEAKDVLFSATVLEGHLLASLVDITARRRAEAEAKGAREELERTAYEVTENIPAGTYTMVLPPGGGMGRFSFMSTRFLEICGLDRKAAEENPFNAFACVHPEDHAEWVRKNAECFEKKIPFSEECRVLAHGVERWILAESVPRELPDGSMVWEGVLTDITRRKTAEAELARIREQERAAEEGHRRELEEKLKTSLSASAIAHEINQPLSRILMVSEIVASRWGGASGLDKKLAPHVKNLAGEAKKVVSTIAKMKALLRNVETRHKRVNLVDVVRDCLQYCAPGLKKGKFRVEFAPPARGLWIQGDAEQLQVALNNLLRNAMEATGAGGSRKIRIELERTRADTRLCVGDSGPGLSETEIRRLLLKSSKPKGSGVGLFLAQTAMQNHAGLLDIGRSALGGAEFRMVFPRGGKA